MEQLNWFGQDQNGAVLAELMVKTGCWLQPFCLIAVALVLLCAPVP